MPNELKESLEKICERLKTDISSLRTGRASSALVEDLMVDYYGTPTPLKAIAAISTPEARSIVIQPWDKNAIQPIEHAIQSSSLGMNPIADRDVIRLAVPALTEERRRELVKVLGRHTEEARIVVRKEREDALRAIDRREKNKEISEDEKFRDRAIVQKTIDEANAKIEDITSRKEKEIMTV